jgi:sporulation integral membrane protein YlbJ
MIKWNSAWVPLSLITIAISMVMFPQDTFNAASKGVDLWWQIVFPSLLPFLIISETMVKTGVVHFFGKLIEPIIMTLFRVSGIGGLVWVMGSVSGFPAGPRLVASLRANNQLNRIEAQRLLSFSHAASPIFITSAISVGFFHQPKLGVLLAISHYLGNILVGLAMTFYGRKEEKNYLLRHNHSFSIKKAFDEMEKTKKLHQDTFANLVGGSIQSSIQTLMMIGGFIILFSVLQTVLIHLHLFQFLSHFLAIGFVAIGWSKDLTAPFLSGILELTMGSQQIGNLSSSLIIKVVLVAFLLGFSGLSIQSQVASLIAKTDLYFKPFFYSRIAHGIFAGILVVIFWKPYQSVNPLAVSAWIGPPEFFHTILPFSKVGPLFTLFVLILFVIFQGICLVKEKERN